MKIRRGATRMVFITKKYAFKIPLLRHWKNFLQGLLCNMQEREFATLKHPLLAPVLFSLPGGWLVVMPRVDVEHYDWHRAGEMLEEWSALAGLETEIALTNLVEPKLDSIGLYKGRVVAVDYG